MIGRLAITLALIALTGAPARAAQDTETPGYRGPAESDIRAAYRNKLDSINADSRKFLDPEAAAKVQINVAKVTLVECNPVANHADHFLCSVLVESSLGNSDSETKRVEILMVKDKEVWRTQ